ncbi:MAG: AAA family ATPase [Pyrinomonadaceae bacterium]
MRDIGIIETATEEFSDEFCTIAISKIALLQENIETVIRGKTGTVKLALAALFAGGHLLIEDVPGIGKTTLAHSIARSLALSFQRIQFTSDLLPSDVIGISVYHQAIGGFEWKPGPIFANIVLADEINRATPKTQSALLEAMAEHQVTFEGITHPLPPPFMVVATQNPTEHHGTYPLPESQLDRFMLCVEMGYPDNENEKKILAQHGTESNLENLQPVMTETDVSALQKLSKSVTVNESLIDYLLAIVEKTRANEAIEVGISPRGSLALLHSAQAYALIEGRDYCTPDDIKALVLPCFAHRIILRSSMRNFVRTANEAESILNEIVLTTEVPI